MLQNISRIIHHLAATIQNMFRHSEQMLEHIIASRRAKHLFLLLLFFVMVFIVSLLVNVAVFPVSRALMTFIDPQLTIVQTHFSFILIISFWAIFTVLSLLGLRFVKPRLHNLISGSIGGTHGPITYALTFVFAFALPLIVVMAIDANPTSTFCETDSF